MLQTKFTELLGCTVPLQQAGMGKLASPALAAVVADAGGLGMVSGIGAAPPEYVAKVLDGLRRRRPARSARTSSSPGCASPASSTPTS